jgi:hypothetical protein
MRRTPMRRGRSRLRPISDRQRQRQQDREQNLLAVLGRYPDCAGLVAGVPACPNWTHGATDGHEPRKRSQGADPTDPQQVIPLCRRAHRWVHDHPADAARLRTGTGQPLLILGG